jgi:hypothetical protein
MAVGASGAPLPAILRWYFGRLSAARWHLLLRRDERAFRERVCFIVGQLAAFPTPVIQFFHEVGGLEKTMQQSLFLISAIEVISIEVAISILEVRALIPRLYDWLVAAQEVAAWSRLGVAQRHLAGDEQQGEGQWSEFGHIVLSQGIIAAAARQRSGTHDGDRAGSVGQLRLTNLS